jgi:YVTN family beta-propeller protein
VVTLIGAGSSAGVGTTTVLIDLGATRTFAERKVTVGQYPDAVAVAPDNKFAYVTSYTGNTVTPINLLTGKAGTAIQAGNGPAGIAVAPDGKRAYVTDAGNSSMGSTVTPINLTTHNRWRRSRSVKGHRGSRSPPTERPRTSRRPGRS